MKYDIITFGSGTRDVYIICKDMKIVEEKKFFTGKGIALSLGSKIEVQDIHFYTGGGATNTAATFRAQGFRVAWCGMVGEDPGGREIIKKLEELGIDTRFVFFTRKKPTNYSVVLCLNPAKDDRTILVYHGASSELQKPDIPFQKLKAKWFYFAPFSGKLAFLFPSFVHFAKKEGIQMAANPGNAQLHLERRVLKEALQKIDILFLNQEEAGMLARTKNFSDEYLLKRLYAFTRGITVITKGPGGAVATDGRLLFRVPILQTKVLDRTGAGDAFASGFVSEFMRTKDIPSALQLGIANSAACISQWGAKEGLLKRGQRWKKVPVRITKLS